MALFSLTADICSTSSTIAGGEEVRKDVVTKVTLTSEFDSARDAFLHIVKLAQNLNGWISKSKVLPADPQTGEVYDPQRLLPAPPPVVCLLGELVVTPVRRIPEVAIKQPYTYKEDES
jgi:hypothetical protein